MAKNRGADLADVVARYKAGEQTLPETVYQGFLKGTLGNLSDVAGYGISQATPEIVKEKATDVIKDVASSPYVQPVIKGASEAWKNLSPRQQANLEATGLLPIGALTKAAYKGAVRPGIDVLEKAPVLGADVGQVPKNLAEGAKTIKRGTQLPELDDMQKMVEGYKSSAENIYSSIQPNTLSFNNSFSAKTLRDVNKTLRKGLNIKERSTAELYPESIKQFSILKDDLINKIRSNEPLDFVALNNYKKLFRDKALTMTDKGNLTADGQRLQSMAKKIEDLITNARKTEIAQGNIEYIDALKSADTNYAKARTLETIMTALDKSGGSTNKLYTQFSNLARNKKEMRAFTPEERELIRNIVRSDNTGKVLEKLGFFGFGGEGRYGTTAPAGLLQGAVGGAVAGGGTAALAGGAPLSAVLTPAAAVVAAGTLANKIRNLKAKSRVLDVVEAVENRKGFQPDLNQRALDEATLSRKAAQDAQKAQMQQQLNFQPLALPAPEAPARGVPSAEALQNVENVRAAQEFTRPIPLTGAIDKKTLARQQATQELMQENPLMFESNFGKPKVRDAQIENRAKKILMEAEKAEKRARFNRIPTRKD
jgi:hypothetical protein